LTATLTRLGVGAGASLPSAASSAASLPSVPVPSAAAQPSDTTAPAWLIATIASAAAIAIAGTALWLRRRPRPTTHRTVADRPATQETTGQPRREPAIHPE
jgi:hypothetical protein